MHEIRLIAIKYLRFHLITIAKKHFLVRFIFMRSWAIYCFVIYFVKHGTGKRVSYAGAQVWRTQLKNPQDAEAFLSLDAQQAISVWNMNGGFVDYLVRASKQPKVNRVLDQRRLDTSMLLEDVQRTLDVSLKQSASNTSSLRDDGHPLDWKSFPKLRRIEEYLQYLAAQIPDRCTLTTIGRSVEHRPIRMLRISNGNPSNKALVMTAGVHAREWIAITSALYLVDTLALAFFDLPKHMRSIDWIIIPVLNPDGYEYSHTRDRLWRKNRQTKVPATGNEPQCKGVDLNRNYDYNWFVPGLSTNVSACHTIYSGCHPFSEPETQAIRDLIKGSKKLPDAFIDVHSYGQVILYPWCSKSEFAKDIDILKSTATAMSQAIQGTTGEKYFHGDGYSTIYPAYGIGSDWFYSLGVLYSFGIEMREGWTGSTKGFLVPSSLIVPTGEDLVAAMTQLSEILANDNRTATQTSHEAGLGSIVDYAIKKIYGFVGLS